LKERGYSRHPMEERAGAKATMQAIEAWKEGQVLDEAGFTYRSLRRYSKNGVSIHNEKSSGDTD
jgi:ribulose 1,5-bisphosphate carboxylase large subunit-like protein